MIDLLFLSWNRREFTEASLKALQQNTDWSLVDSVCCHDDGSVDGANIAALAFTLDVGMRVPRAQTTGSYGSPVGVFHAYLKATEGRSTRIICKLDNDVIVPPGWLNESLAVMLAHPEIDLLGIEPGVGPDPVITRPVVSPHARGILLCDFIGGIGLMRRKIFDGTYGLPEPHGQRHGFTEWQERNPRIKKAWIAPGLPLFLLNRLPIEPWASLSREYVAKGWQRDWPEPYDAEKDKHMWEWWL